LKILQTANLGKSQAGISGSIRYSIYDTLGVQSGSTVNTGIYEIGTDTGLYGVELDMHIQFSGSIVWSVNGNSNIYATEELKADKKFTRHLNAGRWKISEANNTMIFYQDDGSTELITYNLLDGSGSPSTDIVLERAISGSN